MKKTEIVTDNTQNDTAVIARQKNQKILELIGGIASGSRDLSENYKDYLYKSWKQKHDID